MKKRGHLDELQLLKRGDVFKHGFLSLTGLLLVNALLYSYGIEWTSGKWAELTIILFVIVLCSVEFIYYDIYPLTEKQAKGRHLFSWPVWTDIHSSLRIRFGGGKNRDHCRWKNHSQRLGHPVWHPVWHHVPLSLFRL